MLLQSCAPANPIVFDTLARVSKILAELETACNDSKLETGRLLSASGPKSQRRQALGQVARLRLVETGDDEARPGEQTEDHNFHGVRLHLVFRPMKQRLLPVGRSVEENHLVANVTNCARARRVTVGGGKKRQPCMHRVS